MTCCPAQIRFISEIAFTLAGIDYSPSHWILRGNDRAQT